MSSKEEVPKPSLEEIAKGYSTYCKDYPDNCDGEDFECKRKTCPWYDETEPPL